MLNFGRTDDRNDLARLSDAELIAQLSAMAMLTELFALSQKLANKQGGLLRSNGALSNLAIAD
jgi:hypothetical protein